MPETQSINVEFELSASVLDPEEAVWYVADNPDISAVVTDLIAGTHGAVHDHLGSIGIISAEVSMPMGIGGTEATVEAVMDNADALRIATVPGIETTFELRIQDEHIFTGEIVEAKQDEKGKVTMIAQDARKKLLEYSVRLDTREKGQPSTTIVYDLLVRDGPFEDDDVIIDIEDPKTIRYSTSNDTNVTLHQVLKDITNLQGAFTYVDGQNRVHFETVPEIKVREPKYITELNVGDTSTSNERVIVEGPRVDTMMGVFGHNFTASGTSKAEVNKKAGDTRKETRLFNNNIRSVDAASRSAVNTQLVSDLTKSSGTVVMVGDVHYTPFDSIILEDLPKWTPLPEDEYTVSEVRHRVSGTDGYLTEVDVGTDMETLYESYTDTTGHASKRAEQVKEAKNKGLPLDAASDTTTWS